jgi:peptidoglycan/xylan/chitin deacetylase (PgdA/CDA1 family)
MTGLFGKAAAVALAAFATAAAVASAVPAEGPGAPILLYHRFGETPAASTTVTDATFEEQLTWLSTHGYTVARLADVVAALRGGAPLAPQTVAITVDDGRRSQYTEMFPIILRRRVPVTLFVYTDAISVEPDALTWGQIDEMRKSGLVEVQSHTCSHPQFARERERRGAMDYEAFVARELGQSKARLEERLKAPIAYLAWPYGVFDPQLEQAAAKAGYAAAFVVGGRIARPSDDPFALPRMAVLDRDRGEAFRRLLDGGAPERVAEETPLASCEVDAPQAPR